MLELSLLRHAKSDYENYNGDDLSRKVSIKGIKKTYELIKCLEKNKYSVDMVLCSPSRRTLKTLDIVLDYFEVIPKIKVVSEIYYGNEETLVPIIKNNDEGTKSKLIIGHEPTLSSLVSIFSPDKENLHFKNSQIKFSTSSFFKFKFDTQKWSDISSINANIEFYYRPRI